MHFYEMALGFAKAEMAPNMSEWDHKVRQENEVKMKGLHFVIREDFSVDNKEWFVAMGGFIGI